MFCLKRVFYWTSKSVILFEKGVVVFFVQNPWNLSVFQTWVWTWMYALVASGATRPGGKPWLNSIIACSIYDLTHPLDNKANLRGLITATRLEILLKLHSNRRFFSPCDLGILWVTSKNNRAPHLYHVKLCASFQIQAGVTVRKRSLRASPIRIKIGDFFVPHDLEILWITLKNNKAPLLYYVKLCASFQSHWWIQTGVTVWKRPMRAKIHNFSAV